MKSGKKSAPDAEAIRQFIGGLSAKLSSNCFYEFWKDLDRVESLADSIKENTSLGKIEKNVTIEGHLILGKNSIIKAGSRIEGNVYIGEGSVIGPNTYLREAVIIGDGCHIANSEIKNSVILSKSNVPHYSYVGDSIIGENVNLGAGTKIANLRFDNGTVKVEVKGIKVDSGRRKLGVLIGHNTKAGINSSINCGIIVGSNCFIYPGRVVERNLKDNESFK